MYRSLVIAISILLAASRAAFADDLAGGWSGTWTKNGDALPVTVSIEKTASGYSATFDSDALQVVGIPFSEVSKTNGKVHLVLKGDETTAIFDGLLDHDAIKGSFTDGNARGTFELVRADLPAARIQSRDVAFRDKDVTLSGSLLVPSTGGRHAAILFLQGSGPEGRWANRYLAEKFAEAGFVTLIYDKRGVGQSTGDWRKVGFAALADDAVAGIRLLQSLPEVDSSRVGIYGHSQGGTIAPLVADRAGNLGFVIASAAGGIAPADMETYSVENSIGLATLPPAERDDARAYVDALIDVAYRGGSPKTLQALAAQFKNRSWYFDPPPPDSSYWTISRQIASFDPAEFWRSVKAPVLLVYGAHDERVPPVADAEAIEVALRYGRNMRVTVKMFSDADHTFTVVDPPHKDGWPKHESDYVPVLIAWAEAQR